VGRDEPLTLLYRFEAPHFPFSLPGNFMRLLCTIIGILLSAVNCPRHQFPMRHRIAPQLVSNNLPRLTTVIPQQPFKEPFSCSPIALCLQIDVDDLAVPKALRGAGSLGQQPAIDNVAFR
jgi:hypothetical protein